MRTLRTGPMVCWNRLSTFTIQKQIVLSRFTACDSTQCSPSDDDPMLTKHLGAVTSPVDLLRPKCIRASPISQGDLLTSERKQFGTANSLTATGDDPSVGVLAAKCGASPTKRIQDETPPGSGYHQSLQAVSSPRKGLFMATFLVSSCHRARAHTSFESADLSASAFQSRQHNPLQRVNPGLISLTTRTPRAV